MQQFNILWVPDRTSRRAAELFGGLPLTARAHIYIFYHKTSRITNSKVTRLLKIHQHRGRAGANQTGSAFCVPLWLNAFTHTNTQQTQRKYLGGPGGGRSGAWGRRVAWLPSGGALICVGLQTIDTPSAPAPATCLTASNANNLIKQTPLFSSDFHPRILFLVSLPRSRPIGQTIRALRRIYLRRCAIHALRQQLKSFHMS